MRFYSGLLFGLSLTFSFCTAQAITLSEAANSCSYEKDFEESPEWNTEEFNSLLASGQGVDHILVSKKNRRVYLLKNSQIVKSYPAAFGNPRGPKRFEGDKKTPEGVYFITGKNPNSDYHKSLKVSYPNAEDIAYAKKYGKLPGSDIMIHGYPTNPIKKAYIRIVHPDDWTRGCVAVTDNQVDEIYRLVTGQIPITLCPL